MRRRRIRGRERRARTRLVALAALGGAGVLYAISEARTPEPADPPDTATASALGGRRLSIRVRPPTVTVRAGETATYAVRIPGARPRRTDSAGIVGPFLRLRVRKGVPAGARATLSAPAPFATRWKLEVATSESTPAGSHKIKLKARFGARRGRRLIRLVVVSPRQQNFAIAGDLPGPLAPGTSQPLDLAITNPGPAAIAITGLDVQVAVVQAPSADLANPCTSADFAVEQFSGAYGFEVPGASARRLSELGFSAPQWPRVAMVDHPVNQNGCKGASLSLTFAGTSRGGAG